MLAAKHKGNDMSEPDHFSRETYLGDWSRNRDYVIIEGALEEHGDYYIVKLDPAYPGAMLRVQKTAAPYYEKSRMAQEPGGERQLYRIVIKKGVPVWQSDIINSSLLKAPKHASRQIIQQGATGGLRPSHATGSSRRGRGPIAISSWSPNPLVHTPGTHGTTVKEITFTEQRTNFKDLFDVAKNAAVQRTQRERWPHPDIDIGDPFPHAWMVDNGMDGDYDVNDITCEGVLPSLSPAFTGNGPVFHGRSGIRYFADIRLLTTFEATQLPQGRYRVSVLHTCAYYGQPSSTSRPASIAGGVDCTNPDDVFGHTHFWIVPLAGPFDRWSVGQGSWGVDFTLADFIRIDGLPISVSVYANAGLYVQFLQVVIRLENV
jgi:hypothetical protein